MVDSASVPKVPERARTESPSEAIELSVVMPCLNEAETLGGCIAMAQRALREGGISGEIIVADNGSTDGSVEIAERAGARVVHVREKGYGSALMGGIAAARGRYVIMGDADASYDFAALVPFVEKLREGCDLVMGNRFRGGIKPGAMPLLHRYLGNPVLTTVGRVFFGSPCGDFHCGLRGFRREAVLAMDLRTTGMEFASEMVVKATLKGMRIAEVPTTLSPDGRSRRPHLRTWRDGWRHLRFLLLYSPRWLFLYPGLVLVIAGLLTGAWLLPGRRVVGGVSFDVHTLLYSAVAVYIGFQSILFAAFTKVFAIREGLLPADLRVDRWLRAFTLERGLVLGGALTLLGLGGSIYAVSDWGEKLFGELNPERTMRIVIPASLALAVGCQTILSSFFLSVLGMGRK
jgi:glycosyltransferase involved in cell wall biosynthesis